MNQHEMNIALCELRGWKNADHPDVMALKVGWVMPERWCMDPDGTLRFNHHRPDHFNGREALHHCHEAEKLLDTQSDAYAVNLYHVAVDARRRHDDHTVDWGIAYILIHATAHQRAEALCRTLWPERFLT